MAGNNSRGDEGPVKLTKLVPKTGKILSDTDGVKSGKGEVKKLGKDSPKQKNVLQRIQNFFNKDQDKKNEDAGSEDIDEHI